MPLTFAQLKQGMRSRCFPAGEARNLRTAHDKAVVDALVDIQRWVECLQSNNTHLIPHCATYFNCGLTSFDFPRGQIKRLSVVDKKNPKAGVTLVAGLTAGQIVGAETFSIAIAEDASDSTLIAEVEKAGQYDIVIEGKNTSCVYYSPANPQYYRVVVSYTDGSGTAKTVTKDILLRSCSELKSATVEIGAATNVYAVVTPVNEPFTDGGSSITVTVKAASGVEATTGLSSDSLDWCSEIEYEQVDAAVIRQYISKSRACGNCLPIHLFFAIPQALCGNKSRAPAATDEGVPSGLPALQLGYHYPQTGTDATCRASKGYWAIEGGRIYVAPWIQSSETVVVRWEGIKREWVDSDLCSDDPTLTDAVDNYVKSLHYRDWEKDASQAKMAADSYATALASLIYDCEQETKVRNKETIHARGIAPTVALYFNDAQQATARCPGDQEGNDVTVTVPEGTVASLISKADANQKAVEQARTQARAQLNCQPATTVYWNTAQTATSACVATDADAPPPEGNPVTVNIPANAYSSTVSQADADNQALQAAEALADAQLVCTYWNSEQTYTAECESDSGLNQTATIAAKSYSSTISQADANRQAYDAAKNEANDALQEAGCTEAATVYYNTTVTEYADRTCPIRNRFTAEVTQCSFRVIARAAAGRFSSLTSQAEANAAASSAAGQMANAVANQRCVALLSGTASCQPVINVSL